LVAFVVWQLIGGIVMFIIRIVISVVVFAVIIAVLDWLLFRRRRPVRQIYQ
jgi:membrane associated rhomboid family serine protease